MVKSISFLMMAVLFSAGVSVYAAEIFTKEIRVSAQVFEPSCIINNGKRVIVNFDSISIYSVKSGAAKKIVPFTVYCPGIDDSKSLSILINADAAIWDITNIQTTDPGLGVSVNIIGSGKSLPINIHEVTTWGELKNMKLEARVNPHPTIEPAVGQFSAAATITVRHI